MFDGQNFSENSFDEVPVVCKYESHDESAVDIQESDQGREERDGGFDQVSLFTHARVKVRTAYPDWDR